MNFSTDCSNLNHPGSYYMDLRYKNEKPLFIILLTLSLLVWGALLVGTKGIVLVYVLAFFVFYVFAQSAFISYLKGTGVEITHEQFSDLHEKITACGEKLGIEKMPNAYLLHMGGTFNALATRFLGKNFIVLFSDIVDALDEHPDALNFYIGHELGHLKRKHLIWGSVLAPATFLPIIGTAYSRAREYTCDRHGLAACSDPASAPLGLAALAAGGKRWRTMNQESYTAQTKHSSGFWMSLHEIISDYPWLTKRIATLRALHGGEEINHPRRNFFAWFFALFIPRLGMGGGASGMLIFIALIGIMAAISIPAYQEYMVKAKLMQAVSIGQDATYAVEKHYYKYQSPPNDMTQTDFIQTNSEVGRHTRVKVNPDNAIVTLTVEIPNLGGETITFVPSLDSEKHIHWKCSSEDIKASLLPADCR